MVITCFACKSNASFQIIKPLQTFFLKFVAKLLGRYEVYLRSTSFFLIHTLRFSLFVYFCRGLKEWAET